MARTAVRLVKLFGHARDARRTPPPHAQASAGSLLAAGWRRPVRHDHGRRDRRQRASGRSGSTLPGCGIASRRRRATSTLTAPCPARSVSGAASAGAGTPTARTRCTHREPRTHPGTRRGARARSASTARRRPRVCSSAPAAGRSCSRCQRPGLRGRRGHARGPRATRPSRTGRSTRRSPTASCARSSTAAARRRSTCASPSRDNAGNVAQGNPTRLSATSAKVGRRFRRVRSGRVKIPFGRRATLRGRLTLSAGQSLRRPDDRRDVGDPQARRACRRRRARRSRTAAAASRSRFPPARAARTASCSRAPAARSARARGVSVRVPASSTIHASRTRLGGGRVRFSGRLRNRGQRIPGRGLVLVLQGREGGKWRTFEDTRTNRQGPLARELPLQRPPGELPDPRPHPQAVGLSRSSSATRAG